MTQGMRFRRAWPWLAAGLLYLIFLAWHDGWFSARGPLTAAEIDRYLQAIEGAPAAEVNDPAVIRAFLEADDGEPFVMLNLVRIRDTAIHPVTGAEAPARDLLLGYFRSFLGELIPRGGYPALSAQPVGGYVDAWGVEANPGWTTVGMIRYRSRRDMMELATHPDFGDAHAFKIAAIDNTFSFPMHTGVGLLLGPKLWLGLLLALGAALVHLLTSLRELRELRALRALRVDS